MHDPMSFMANLFAHEHARFQYAHENYPDDSMLRAAIYFWEAMNKITYPNVKSHVYKYQKDLKIRILHEREAKLKIKEDLQKENT